MTKKIVVVGGGTAGWLTALSVKKAYSDFDVTVIESKEIGILGAGEGSVPQLVEFFESLDISVTDLIQNCDATLKNGIKFTNWNNDNKFYYHGFGTSDDALDISAGMSKRTATYPLLVASLSLNNTINEVDFTEKISENKKAPFILKDKNNKNKISDYEQLANFSIHFNATRLADRLKEIGIGREIKVIENTIKTVSLDSSNYVSGFVLDNKEVVKCDFVFDCSGFHRLIIGKVFNSTWKSYSNILPVDSAVPFFIDMDDQIPSYTEAIAMKYGWMWKIPLQSRFGCGYVYDSSLISEADAIKEIEEFLGYEPVYPRKNKGGFNFNAGCYEESWINNCIAIGLSSSFIEPLEATSLWVSVFALNKIFSGPEWVTTNVLAIRNEFNKMISKTNNEIVNFIYFHYMSLRKDTEFWNQFSYENAPQELKEKLDLWQHRLPNKDDSQKLWPFSSWFLIGSGTEYINKTITNNYIDNMKKYNIGLEKYNYFLNYQNYKSSECVDHKEFLKSLK